jgi:hypothetical protein
MIRFSIAVLVIGVGALSIVTSGCAGELTDEQKENRDGAVGTGGSAGAGGGSGGKGGTGSAPDSGGGGNPEACVLDLIGPTKKSCGVVGCHGGANPAAQFLLTEQMIRQPKDSLVDKPNKGNKGATPGCAEGIAKLIDKAQPEKSLLYTKLTLQSPCGDRMPQGNPLNDAELSCMLNWIRAVAAAP